MNELRAASNETSRRMARIGRRDTAAEMAIRRLIHAAGLRYRVQLPVPGRPRRTIDVAFTRLRVAVFVDGCYWHGCPLHATQSKTNVDWWRSKIEANRQRDADTNRALTERNWLVIRIWEHQSPVEAAAEIERIVARRVNDIRAASSR